MVRNLDLELLRSVGLSILILYFAYKFVLWFCYKYKPTLDYIKNLQIRWKPFLFVGVGVLPALNLCYWNPNFTQFYVEIYITLMLMIVLMTAEALISAFECFELRKKFSPMVWSVTFGIIRAVIYSVLIVYSYSSVLKNEVLEGGFFAASCCIAAVYMVLNFLYSFVFEDMKFHYEKLGDFLHNRKPLGYCLVLVLTAVYASTWLPQSIRENYNISRYLLVAVAILIWSFIIEAILVLVFDIFLKEKKSIRVSKLIQDMTRLIVYMMLVLILVSTVFNLNLSSLLVGSTAMSLVLGLALQEVLGNLVAGLFINVAKQYSIGDYVDIGGLTGTVEKVDWRSTVLRTLSGERNILPNSSVAKSNVKNYSSPTKLQGRTVEVGAGYEHSPDLVRRVINLALKSVTGVLQEPAPKIWLVNFADSSITYRVFFWVEDFSTGVTIESNVREAIWYYFSREKINIPFPITTIYQGKNNSEDLNLNIEPLRKCSYEFVQALQKSFASKLFAPQEQIWPFRGIGEPDTLLLIKSGKVELTQNEEKKLLGTGTVLHIGDEQNITLVTQEETEVLTLKEFAFTEFREKYPEDVNILLTSSVGL